MRLLVPDYRQFLLGLEGFSDPVADFDNAFDGDRQSVIMFDPHKTPSILLQLSNF